MSDSLDITGRGVIDVSVLSDGNDVGDLTIISVEVVRRVNMIPLASLVFDDGDMPRQEFPLSDASTLAPGVNIEIKAGYDNKKEMIFKGVACALVAATVRCCGPAGRRCLC